jgi:hypothetical protein
LVELKTFGSGVEISVTGIIPDGGSIASFGNVTFLLPEREVDECNSSVMHIGQKPFFGLFAVSLY